MEIKRTGERVLGIIGLVMFVIGGLIFGLVSVASGQGIIEDFLMELTDPESMLFEEEGAEDIEPIADADAEYISEFISNMNFTLYSIVAFLTAGAGLAAVIVVKKKPIVASILFLGSTIVYGVLTFVTLTLIVPLLPMLLYIIAGIMALARKPKSVETI
ncbi:DUF4064 domain-containing protein [Shouchella patagoniensis]|uniref:DUF4064 domain-containing protein n=1 Tax=Shouchella patagoniensis TaxID=228576 RepID=UPI00099533B5|nr:DUF4064 domain-containing protein [Shouchella patagoniensis]